MAELQDAQQPLSTVGRIAEDYACAHPDSKLHLFSKSPLVIYVQDFLPKDEREHLKFLADGRFTRSGVVGAGGESSRNAVRTSQSTSIPRDRLVACVQNRAMQMQGFDVKDSHLEPLQLVKYAPTEHYHFHTDWFTDPAQSVASLGGNRVSSIFAYVKADNVTGGGTNFPILQAPKDEKWCQFIDCDEEYDKGVTFRPIEGNAIYWENMLDSGKGDDRVLHAGLPVVSGEKIGMNIWTRQRPLPASLRSA